MKPLQPAFFFAAFVLLVGLACSAVTGGGTTPTQAPPASPTEEPVQNLPTATESAPEPTEVPPTEGPPPTEEAASASEFYTEEFDSENALANWESFTLGQGEDRNLVIKQEDDHLLFDLGDEDL